MQTVHKIALARMGYRLIRLGRSLSGQSDKALVRRAGFMWELDLSEVIDFCIYLFGSFEGKTIRLYRRTVKPGDIVIDVGANIGAHTLPLAKLVGNSGKVIAVEPTVYAFQKLGRNVSLNPDVLGQISLLQALVVAPGAKAVDPKVYSSWPFESSEKLHEKHRGKLMSTVGAAALTVDEIVRSYGLTKVDLVKIDVDGYESRVLAGAMDTINKFKPDIVLELAPVCYIENPQAFDDIFNLLQSLGATMMNENTLSSLPLDAEAMRKIIPAGTSCNVLIRF